MSQVESKNADDVSSFPLLIFFSGRAGNGGHRMTRAAQFVRRIESPADIPHGVAFQVLLTNATVEDERGAVALMKCVMREGIGASWLTNP